MVAGGRGPSAAATLRGSALLLAVGMAAAVVLLLLFVEAASPSYPPLPSVAPDGGVVSGGSPLADHLAAAPAIRGRGNGVIVSIMSIGEGGRRRPGENGGTALSQERGEQQQAASPQPGLSMARRSTAGGRLSAGGVPYYPRTLARYVPPFGRCPAPWDFAYPDDAWGTEPTVGRNATPHWRYKPRRSDHLRSRDLAAPTAEAEDSAAPLRGVHPKDHFVQPSHAATFTIRSLRPPPASVPGLGSPLARQEGASGRLRNATGGANASSMMTRGLIPSPPANPIDFEETRVWEHILPDQRTVFESEHERCHYVMLRQLAVLASVMRHLNLKSWFVTHGTLLGAVRHGTLIPWDVDVDVAMPRSHITALRKYWRRQFPRDSFLQTEKTERSFHYWVGKERGMRLKDRYSTFVGVSFSSMKKGKLYRSTKWHVGCGIDLIPYEKKKGGHMFRVLSQYIHKDDLFPLGTTCLGNVLVPAPRNISSVLTTFYGLNYMTEMPLPVAAAAVVGNRSANGSGGGGTPTPTPSRVVPPQPLWSTHATDEAFARAMFTAPGSLPSSATTPSRGSQWSLDWRKDRCVRRPRDDENRTAIDADRTVAAGSIVPTRDHHVILDTTVSPVGMVSDCGAHPELAWRLPFEPPRGNHSPRVVVDEGESPPPRGGDNAGAAMVVVAPRADPTGTYADDVQTPYRLYYNSQW